MAKLQRLDKINFEQLLTEDKVAYLKNSMLTSKPEFLHSEPVLKRSWLIRNLAEKRMLMWMAMAVILAALTYLFYIVDAISLLVSIILWVIIVAGLVVYFVYRKKVDAFFIAYHDKLNKRFAKKHANKLERYEKAYAEYEQALDEYNARELSLEQALHTVDTAIYESGLQGGKKVFDIDESKLIAYHYITKPTGSVSKVYEGKEVHANYLVQFIYVTDDELCELSTTMDLFDLKIRNHTTSRVAYSQIKDCQRRSDEFYALDYYAITTESSKGVTSDVMYLPSRELRPLVHYYIRSVTWENLDNKRPDYQTIRSGRKQAKRLLNTPLTLHEFQDAVTSLNNLHCRDYQYDKVRTDTELDKANFSKLQLVVEREINRKIRESTMNQD